jgi:hypothetical protein
MMNYKEQELNQPASYIHTYIHTYIQEGRKEGRKDLIGKFDYTRRS